MHALIQKYNIACPRYTSYPTVPYWEEAAFDLGGWKTSLLQSFNESNPKEGISLYIHLPFCESLCTFCGCNKQITKRHDVEEPYIRALLAEWDMYTEMFGSRPMIKELHLGGGTPTFFDSHHLRALMEGIFQRADRAKAYEFSFEGHPNHTDADHLKTLYNAGFRRVSFGVQDYDKAVQKAIHRHQPFEQVEKVTNMAREIGYTSVGHDLVFGLPFQTLRCMRDTIEKTERLAPDRIAFYSYAHVPWLKGNGQRGFDEKDLPKDGEKRALYELGKELLAGKGYYEIGMDHFALPSDNLYTSAQARALHRNFMGYTASKTQLMVGLGVSSIGDTWYSFAQNEKSLKQYYALIEAGQLPIARGHLLTAEDLIVRKHILNLMCRFQTSWEDPSTQFSELPEVIESLAEMARDRLVTIGSDSLHVTDEGRAFIRNVCMAFDLRLKRKAPQTRIFSMAV